MTWQTFVLRLVELLRPRFYNRITWLIVLGGLAMMSTQLWELVASEILKREFNELKGPWSNKFPALEQSQHPQSSAEVRVFRQQSLNSISGS